MQFFTWEIDATSKAMTQKIIKTIEIQNGEVVKNIDEQNRIEKAPIYLGIITFGDNKELYEFSYKTAERSYSFFKTPEPVIYSLKQYFQEY